MRTNRTRCSTIQCPRPLARSRAIRSGQWPAMRAVLLSRDRRNRVAGLGLHSLDGLRPNCRRDEWAEPRPGQRHRPPRAADRWNRFSRGILGGPGGVARRESAGRHRKRSAHSRRDLPRGDSSTGLCWINCSHRRGLPPSGNDLPRATRTSPLMNVSATSCWTHRGGRLPCCALRIRGYLATCERKRIASSGCSSSLNIVDW